MTMTVGGLPSLFNTTANNNYDVPTHPKLNTTIATATGKRVYSIIRSL